MMGTVDVPAAICVKDAAGAQWSLNCRELLQVVEGSVVMPTSGRRATLDPLRFIPAVVRSALVPHPIAIVVYMFRYSSE